MKFFIRTLGCKMNALDSARVTAALQSAGHEPVASEAEADTVFVNTCTVTAEADRKSRKEVNAATRKTQQVAVMGCGPRVDTVQWHERVPQQQLVFTDEQALYRRFGVDLETLPFPLSSRTRLPVAIQNGCDNECTFCITRVARGRHRNVPAGTVVDQIREAEAAGIREVILTGINLAAWGADDSNCAEQARLHQLLERILAETSMPRIRLSSLGPQYLHDGFFELFSEPRLCAYLHLSLQSGSAGVLDRMVRGHGVAEVYRIADRARVVRPETALAADVIAGFPGESDAEHRETLALLETIAFAKLHVFPYSLREGTPAADLPGAVPEVVRRQRAADIRELGRAMRRAFVESQWNRTYDVLAESAGTGLTGNYIRLRVPADAKGTIVPVTVTPERLAERIS